MASFIRDNKLELLIESLEYIRDNSNEASSLGVGVLLPRALKALREVDTSIFAPVAEKAGGRCCAIA